MDPLTLSLIFQGLRLAAQLLSEGLRARVALDELETFLVMIHEEGRPPTPEEFRQFTGRTAEIDSNFRSKLQALQKLVDDGGGPIPPAADPVVTPPAREISDIPVASNFGGLPDTLRSDTNES